MGGKTSWSTLGLQDHQTRRDRRNPIVGMWDRGNYPGRHQHADTPGKSGPKSERRPTPFDAGSLGGKASAGPNPCHSLSTANSGSSLKGEAQGIPSQRPGPEVRGQSTRQKDHRNWDPTGRVPTSSLLAKATGRTP